jgi:hypothetical protein
MKLHFFEIPAPVNVKEDFHLHAARVRALFNVVFVPAVL